MYFDTACCYNCLFNYFTDKKTHRRFLKIKIDALSQFFVYYLKGPLCVDTC